MGVNSGVAEPVPGATVGGATDILEEGEEAVEEKQISESVSQMGFEFDEQ